MTVEQLHARLQFERLLTVAAVCPILSYASLDGESFGFSVFFAATGILALIQMHRLWDRAKEAYK